jgi:transmembrane sensor
MERPVRAKFNTQIYEEACAWFIECRAGDLDDVAGAEFDRWLRKSPEHQSAYLEIAAIWNEGPTLDPANRWDPDTLISQAAEDPGNIVALERTSRPPSDTSQPVPNTIRAGEPAGAATLASSPEAGRGRGLRPREAPVATVGRRPLFAIAATIFLVTAAIATYLLAPRGVYATDLGEQRSFALNDGSTVQLNSLSKIRIRYTEHERTVDLLQGQALFHVAKGTTRPFIVYSGQTRVRAIGTQFDVYRKANDTVVTVVEGRVAVLGIPEPAGSAARSPRGERQGAAPREGEASAPSRGAEMQVRAARDHEGAIFLAAGEQITVSPQVARKTPHPNLAVATAWTQRQLIFDSATLTDVAEEFNRYNERKLVIDPSALGTLHISGVFSSTDPASLIRFLRDRPGLRVTETPTQIRVEKDL